MQSHGVIQAKVNHWVDLTLREIETALPLAVIRGTVLAVGGVQKSDHRDALTDALAEECAEHLRTWMQDKALELREVIGDQARKRTNEFDADCMVPIHPELCTPVATKSANGPLASTQPGRRR